MRHIIRFAIALLIIGLSLPLHSEAQERELHPPEFEMERAALEFVETYHPSRLEEIKHLKTAEPEHYIREIAEIWHRTEELKKLQKEHPELYALETQHEKLEEKTFLLIRSYQTAKGKKEKQNIKQQLEKTVSKQFDIREQIKGYELKQMEAELQNVKEKLRQRKANRSKIVEHRVNQLLNTSAGLGWE